MADEEEPHKPGKNPHRKRHHSHRTAASVRVLPSTHGNPRHGQHRSGHRTISAGNQRNKQENENRGKRHRRTAQSVAGGGDAAAGFSAAGSMSAAMTAEQLMLLSSSMEADGTGTPTPSEKVSRWHRDIFMVSPPTDKSNNSQQHQQQQQQQVHPRQCLCDQCLAEYGTFKLYNQMLGRNEKSAAAAVAAAAASAAAAADDSSEGGVVNVASAVTTSSSSDDGVKEQGGDGGKMRRFTFPVRKKKGQINWSNGQLRGTENRKKELCDVHNCIGFRSALRTVSRRYCRSPGVGRGLLIEGRFLVKEEDPPLVPPAVLLAVNDNSRPDRRG